MPVGTSGCTYVFAFWNPLLVNMWAGCPPIGLGGEEGGLKKKNCEGGGGGWHDACAEGLNPAVGDPGVGVP